MAERPSRRFPVTSSVTAFVMGALSVQVASAEEHVVRTRRTEWIPAVLFIQPGDTVIFQGMRTHETMLIEGMAPPGGETWRSELDAEGFSVTLNAVGAYVYSCDIHINGGMVGAIIVGDAMPTNLNAIDAALENVANGRIFVERVIGRMKRALARR